MPKKILIVEDEQMLREMYKQKFSEAGYEVTAAENAEKGFILAKQKKPDLILLDILLPKENGNVLLKKVREEAELVKTKVIAFSNYDDPVTRKIAEELNVLDYLIKTSYTPKQIVEKVKSYLK